MRLLSICSSEQEICSQLVYEQSQNFVYRQNRELVYRYSTIPKGIDTISTVSILFRTTNLLQLIYIEKFIDIPRYIVHLYVNISNAIYQYFLYIDISLPSLHIVKLLINGHQGTKKNVHLIEVSLNGSVHHESVKKKTVC